MKLQREKLTEANRELIGDIGECIMAIVRARLAHDAEAEGIAMHHMEGLMTASIQQLDCNNDFLAQDLDIDSIELAGYKRGVEAACEWLGKPKNFPYISVFNGCAYVDYQRMIADLKKDLL